MTARTFARSDTQPQVKLGIKDTSCGRQEAVPPGGVQVDERGTCARVAQAQVRADSERATVRYQMPPPRFSAPRTRNRDAHP